MIGKNRGNRFSRIWALRVAFTDRRKRRKFLQEKDPPRRTLNTEYKFFNLLILIMVGTGRFELPTPRTPSECSTRLSHVPTQLNRSASANGSQGPNQFTPPAPFATLSARQTAPQAPRALALPGRQGPISNTLRCPPAHRVHFCAHAHYR